jgi:hypothetical protein
VPELAAPESPPVPVAPDDPEVPVVLVPPVVPLEEGFAAITSVNSFEGSVRQASITALASKAPLPAAAVELPAAESVPVEPVAAALPAAEPAVLLAAPEPVPMSPELRKLVAAVASMPFNSAHVDVAVMVLLDCARAGKAVQTVKMAVVAIRVIVSFITVLLVPRSAGTLNEENYAALLFGTARSWSMSRGPQSDRESLL